MVKVIGHLMLEVGRGVKIGQVVLTDSNVTRFDLDQDASLPNPQRMHTWFTSVNHLLAAGDPIEVNARQPQIITRPPNKTDLEHLKLVVAQSNLRVAVKWTESYQNQLKTRTRYLLTRRKP